MTVHVACLYYATCIRLHVQTVYNPREEKYDSSKKANANFACSRKRRIVVAGAIRSEIRRNFAAKPLSESARFKIYRRRVIFAIPTRRSRGVCYSTGSAESVGRSQARELHKHARTKRSCSCSQRVIVRDSVSGRSLSFASVVISNRTKRQIIIDDPNVVSDS